MNKTIKRALALGMLAALALLITSPAMAYGWTPYGIFVALGTLCAYMLLMYLRRCEARALCPEGAASIGWIGRADALEMLLWCVPAALAGARLSYCLARFSFYFVEMSPLSVLRVWEGGFLLYGAAAGVMLAAGALAKRRRISAALVLDELAAPGLLAIAIARLGEWVTGEGVGAWMESEALMRFPIAVMNTYEEWQLAVFLFEAAAALLLLIPVLRRRTGAGERIMTALLLYACCQVFFESLRMDSCLKIGFVRVSQVASAVVIMAVTVMRTMRMKGGRCAAVRAAVTLVCVAIVGGLEWALDKTPVSNILIYTVMIAACAAMAVNGTYAVCREKN